MPDDRRESEATNLIKSAAGVLAACQQHLEELRRALQALESQTKNVEARDD
jgi:ABC-type transporter Mla subunit MlaD